MPMNMVLMLVGLLNIAASASSAYDAWHLQLVGAHSYMHCYNMPRHTYCQKEGHLPQNWPPNSNMPGTPSLRNLRHAQHSHAGGDRRDGWLLWR